MRIDCISFSSVAQSCLTLCDPMDCSTPGFPVHHQLSELTQTHVHWVGDAIQPSHSLVVPFFSCLQPFPASGSFPMSQFFESGGQSIAVSASASALPMNIQDWFSLGWTCWIYLLSKGLSKVFSKTTVQKHHPLAPSFFHIPNLTSIHDYWKNNSFDLMDMSLSKLRELVMDREAWPAAVHRVAKCRIRLSDCTELTGLIFIWLLSVWTCPIKI